MKFYLEIQEERKKLAFSKAVLDCEKIMKDMGYQSILIGNYAWHRLHLYDVCFCLNCIKLLKLKAGDLLVVRFPAYISNRVNRFLYHSLTHIRKNGVRLVLLVHDLNSIRFTDETAAKWEKEYLKIADAVISHNERMKAFLISQYGIPEEKIIPLGVFDYLCERKLTDSEITGEKKTTRIVIAGNLAKDKAGYIYKAGMTTDNSRFMLYGVNAEPDLFASNMEYKGSFEPEELPNHIDGDFGLVWDGDSPETCSGLLGNYLRYNNPHKCSLYLASGLPVIIWEEAALAGFVKQNGIGITVSSLKDAAQKIAGLSEEDYQQMKEKAEKIGKDAREGLFLKRALLKVEETMHEEI